MRFKDKQTLQILVGLDRIGFTGLRSALQRAAESEATERERIVDLVLAALAKENYIADPDSEDLRTAIWREYLRVKGGDFQQFLSTIEVTVRGRESAERARFVEMLTSILADFELRPEVTWEAAPPGSLEPQLEIQGEVVVSGMPCREKFKQALRQRLSHW